MKHESEVLLGVEADTGHHTAVADCNNAVRLYNKYLLNHDKKRVSEAKKALSISKPSRNIVRDLNYVIDEVCMAKYNSNKCTCGQDTS